MPSGLHKPVTGVEEMPANYEGDRNEVESAAPSHGSPERDTGSYPPDPDQTQQGHSAAVVESEEAETQEKRGARDSTVANKVTCYVHVFS